MQTKALLLSFILGLSFYCCESGEERISVSPDTFEAVSAEGENIQVTLTCGSDWTSSSTEEWCHVSPSQGAGNQVLTITTDPNLQTSERSAVITITGSSGIACTVSITQQAGSITNIENYHYELPVIFHVFYQDRNDALQYVSQSRLSAIISNVNKRYKAGSQSIEMNLSLTLATEDENGHSLATPGVEYIQWSGEYPIDCNTFMSDNIRSGGKGYVNYIWDPNKYINVMLYNFKKEQDSNSITLGISHLPFTNRSYALPGTSTTSYPYLEKENLAYPHCISINSTAIHQESTATIYNPQDVNVTLAHELGHYLGLLHVFSEAKTGCNDTDYCADTPSYDREEYMEWLQDWVSKNQNVYIGDVTKRQNCQGTQFTSRNIMDYEYSYSDQFTADQKARIRHILNYGLMIPGPKLTGTNTRAVTSDGVIDLPIRTMK